MRRDEVHGDIFSLAVREEAVVPSGLRGCRPSDSQAGADALESASGVIVQIVVRGLLWVTRPKVDIGLIPYFEIPLCDLILAVSLHQMPRERLDKLLPFAPVLWRSNILLVPERVQGVRIGGELLGHEAQFDERTHFVVQQSIVDLIDIGKVVDRFAGSVFVVNADFVMEDGVEAHVFESGDALRLAQIVEIAFAKGEDVATGCENMFPQTG